MTVHEKMMLEALAEARKAFDEGEIPVGAVIALDGEIIARAHNLREQTGDPTAHAEVLAIRQAAEKLGGRRLDRCTLYVTLEPCPMCAGAMVMACLQKCYFGARDERQGCCESVYALPSDPAFYHRVLCVGGLLEEPSAQLLKQFFAQKGGLMSVRLNIDTIVTDMDGTLLNPQRVISDYTLEVLNECRHKGIRVIPASGRTRASMKPHVQRLDTGMPYIGGNGSEIVGPDHQLIHQLSLDIPLARELCAYLTDAGFHVQIYGDEAFYYARECEASERYKRSSGLPGVAVGDLTAFLDFRTPKILAIGDPSLVEKTLPLVSKAYEGRATVTVSEVNFLEVEPLGATKGEALRRLADMRGDIMPQRTVAFGDSLNDLSLLQFTPYSVAMGNAREELKAQAAYVCGPNSQDGLARFLQEYVL